MKKALSVVPLILLIVAPAVCSADTRSEIQALYDRMAEGIKNRDAGPIIAMLAPDFRNSGMGMTQNRKQFEKTMKEHMKSTKSVQLCSLKVRKLTEKGRTATVEVNSKIKLVTLDEKGEMGPKGQEHHLDMDMLDRETWARTARGWKLNRSESLGGKFLVDGKEIPMTPPHSSKKPGR